MPAPNATPAHVRQRIEARHTRIVGLGYKDYGDYLLSHTWRALRRRYSEERPWICNVCGKTEKLTLHHRTYERVGEELLDDLMPLCGNCHEMVHALERRGDTSLDFDGVINLQRAIKGMAENREREARQWADREAGRQDFLDHLETLPLDVRLRRVDRDVEPGIRRDRIKHQKHILVRLIEKGRSREQILNRIRAIERMAYRL